jgi:hypothetical protein
VGLELARHVHCKYVQRYGNIFQKTFKVRFVLKGHTSLQKGFGRQVNDRVFFLKDAIFVKKIVKILFFKATLISSLSSCYSFISITHKRTEGRAPVWGSEFTTKDAKYMGNSAEIAAGLK